MAKSRAEILKYFAKAVGRGIHRHNMISDGDRVMVGVSGGKDSLALCFALKERMRWLPIRYEVTGVQIQWEEYPIPREQLEKTTAFFCSIGVPYKIITAPMGKDNKKFNCYACSRKRKQLLFTEAEARGIKKIALGHHMDDMIETSLINLFHSGEFFSMEPVKEFFDGKFHIIRPMVEVKEQQVARAAALLDVPVLSIPCPFKDTSQRAVVKDIIRQMGRYNKKVRENIYHAIRSLKK